MGNKKRFWESEISNSTAYYLYYTRLLEKVLARFEWFNLPDTIDARFLEMALVTDGHVLFFEDEELGGLLALRCTLTGGFNIYNEALRRDVFSNSGYHTVRSINDSVLIYNNFIRNGDWMTIRNYASRLWEYDRIIDINVRAQKTPILIRSTEQEKYSLLQVYQKFAGNEPLILGSDHLSPNALEVLRTDAPFNAPAIYALKIQLQNEFDTYFGILNESETKKERLTNPEIAVNSGSTMAFRNNALAMRQMGCEAVNKAYGTNIWCEYRQAQDELLSGGADDGNVYSRASDNMRESGRED